MEVTFLRHKGPLRLLFESLVIAAVSRSPVVKERINAVSRCSD
jgi:hypothetical protein